jgi:hypothetical protein
MIQQAYITAWRSVAPWSDDAQVEQDLALSRATAEAAEFDAAPVCCWRRLRVLRN